MSKLTNEDVKTIRMLYKPRIPGIKTRVFGMKKIAKLFGITHQGVYYVIKQGWHHIK